MSYVFILAYRSLALSVNVVRRSLNEIRSPGPKSSYTWFCSKEYYNYVLTYCEFWKLIAATVRDDTKRISYAVCLFRFLIQPNCTYSNNFNWNHNNNMWRCMFVRIQQKLFMPRVFGVLNIHVHARDWLNHSCIYVF